MVSKNRFALLVVVLLSLFAVLATPDTAHARRRRNNGGGTGYSVIPAGHSNATAQGVANIMATTGYVGHFGGNPGYEGCGSGGSWQAAYNNCCFANSGMYTVDYGVAQGANGMWFCCRRYGNRPVQVAPKPAAASEAAPVVTQDTQTKPATSGGE